MDRTKLITSLVILCLASAVAAFLMPPAHGALLSFVSIASAAVIAVLAVVTLVRMLMQRRAFRHRGRKSTVVIESRQSTGPYVGSRPS